jgi:hypothetical protein
LKIVGILIREAVGHKAIVLVGSLTMLFTGFISSYLGAAAQDVLAAASVGIVGWLPLAVATFVVLSPAIFAAVAMLLLVEVASAILKHEAGVYVSQGVRRSSLLRAWIFLYGIIPALCYVLGLVAYVEYNNVTSVQVEVALPLLSAVILGPILVLRNLQGILAEFPYAVIRA